jgi:outer membrane lipoprotein-sorting protein
MKYARIAVIGLLALVATANVASAGEMTLEEVQKDICEKFEKIRFLSATSRLQSLRDTPKFTMSSKGAGTLEYAFIDGKQLIFMTESRDMETIFKDQKVLNGAGKGGNSMKSTFAGDFLNDGESIYTILGKAGGKSVMKDKIDREGIPRFGRNFFEYLPKFQTPKLLPNEKHENQDVYVIEGVVPNRGKNNPVASMRYYFRIADGIMVKQTNHEEDGNTLSTTIYENFKIDVPIPRERFVLNVPPGTVITDASQGPNPNAAMAGGPRPTTQPSSAPSGGAPATTQPPPFAAWPACRSFRPPAELRSPSRIQIRRDRCGPRPQPARRMKTADRPSRPSHSDTA